MYDIVSDTPRIVSNDRRILDALYIMIPTRGGSRVS